MDYKTRLNNTRIIASLLLSGIVTEDKGEIHMNLYKVTVNGETVIRKAATEEKARNKAKIIAIRKTGRGDVTDCRLYRELKPKSVSNKN